MKARGGRAAPKPKPRKAPAKRAPQRKARPEPSPELVQRRLDLVAVALLGLAVYSAFVVYAGSDGGTIGNGADRGLAWSMGAAGIAAPVILGLAGLGLLLRPMLPSPGALAGGTIGIGAGVLLALAAQTAGLGPELPVRTELFDPRYFTEHGGLIGETLYWATTTLFQRIGAHITVIVLIVGGAMLASGRSFADLVGGVMGAARRAGDGVSDFATAVRETHLTDEDLIRTDEGETEPLFGPPEPVSEEPIINRITLGALDGLADTSEQERERFAPPEFEDDADAALDAAETTEFSLIRGGRADAHEAPEDADPSGAGEPEVPAEPDPAAVIGVTPQGYKRTGFTESEQLDYTLPDAGVLTRGKAEKAPADTRDRDATARALLEALGHFGIEAQMVGVVSGPHVSRYELRLAPGTKMSKITTLKDDLAYALASTDIRILAPIPGKQAVGVEVPNNRRRLVRLGDIYGGRPKDNSPLTAWLGTDIAGHSISTDLQKMPHILVAGTTGSGKSGCVNAILSSLLLHASPNELRLVLVDPKQVELNHYEKIPHLLTPVVTSPRMAANVLNNLLAEMESRYTVMADARARSLDELNKVRAAQGEAPLPYILCVIDELADLMMVAPAEVEDAIIRLAQKSRAIGIHLLLATQRPSTDIITGTIKVNIPSRIAFAVSSQVDSRVILDQGGAESLLGQGDMLFRGAGTSKLQRIQGAFITEGEIARITGHWAKQGEPEFAEELLAEPQPVIDEDADGDFNPDRDDLLEQAARCVVEGGTASVSMIQRRLRVGYTRAGRLIDMLERRKIISGYEGSKPRQVLVSLPELERVLSGGGAAEAPAPGSMSGAVPGPVDADTDQLEAVARD